VSKSRMSCRIELEGEACPDPGLSGNDDSGKASQGPAAKKNKDAAEHTGVKRERDKTSRNGTTADMRSAVPRRRVRAGSSPDAWKIDARLPISDDIWNATLEHFV
jgi:hypothetical protein